MKELPKAYEPKQYEDNIYKKWEESGFFAPEAHPPWVDNPDDPNRPSFSIVLPPPNVTGTLHMGHAAMLAIEDLMVRYHRMKGDRTLWVPGTDSAAVATEAKVEKMLITEGGMERPKETLGREKFLERVNAFAAESHDTIVNQLKKMGSSLDWSREAFTLDESRYKAVYTVFKKMYDDGLIYRGHRVINWSVKGQSTCSDDELVHVERPGKLYYFKYSKDFPIPIATTRPETKLGDTAVAVNPKGKWKKYIGKEFIVESFGQKGHALTIKVIGDKNVDDDYGTGALGMTPAHSMVDFEMYQAQKAAGNDIGLIQVIGEDGNMTNAAGSEYVGLSVKEAREKVVTWLEAEGLLEKIEDVMQSVGTSDRFGDVVEPLPKTQWFVNVNKKFPFHVSSRAKRSGVEGSLGIKNGEEVTLKELMQAAVRNKQVKIVPERFEKTYFHWIDNLRDWCISRQIWYGHRIPVWYKKVESEKSKVERDIYVGVEPPKDIENWEQDPDTLDTWFSSGLWTFSTLGWPEEADDLKTFHPTSVLETGYDILFFWVARMILMSTYVLGEVPFETVYLHGLVRDEEGRKMSKSLGNVINPLDMIEKYGTDATRLSLVIGTTPGNDMKLSEEKAEGFRNFANKLWNISRFMLMNIEEPILNPTLPKDLKYEDKWILLELEDTIKGITYHIENYNFSLAGEILREFTWDKLADIYLEDSKIGKPSKMVLNFVLNAILKLWHPFIPFVTEAIWKEMYDEEDILMVQSWPHEFLSADQTTEYRESINIYQFYRHIINWIRKIKGDYGVVRAKKVWIVTSKGAPAHLSDFIRHIEKNAGVESVEFIDQYTGPKENPSFDLQAFKGYIDIAADPTKEQARLQKEIDNVEPYVIGLEKKLGGEFAKKAPKDVVNVEEKKLAEAKEKLEKLKEQMETLK